MSLYDGLIDSIFKEDTDGRTIFYPWGVLGKGYILSNDMAKQRVRNILKRQYIILRASQ